MFVHPRVLPFVWLCIKFVRNQYAIRQANDGAREANKSSGLCDVRAALGLSKHLHRSVSFNNAGKKGFAGLQGKEDGKEKGKRKKIFGIFVSSIKAEDVIKRSVSNLGVNKFQKLLLISVNKRTEDLWRKPPSQN